MRQQIFELIEAPRAGNPRGRIVDGLLIVLIVLSVSAALLETETESRQRFGQAFVYVEAICGLVFTLEFFARVWVAPLARRNRGLSPWRSRVRYILSPLGLIDLLSVFPYWLAVLTPMTIGDLWLFRMIRVLKLLRFTSGFEIFATVISNERGPLLAGLTVMISLLVVLSSLMYLVERNAQPESFGSVPAAMWWGIVTLATVGYGDVVPVTPLGRVIGSFTVVIGLGLFALPTGILASGFVEESRRRNFVVTWNLVASVPFFQNLPAARIADIADVLIPQVAVKGEQIVQAGEPADCMYFIVSGECAVIIQPRPVRLSRGDFFGEIALLTDSPRTATVTAVSSAQLLVLRVSDFRRILEVHADLRETISRVAEERLARNTLATPAGSG